MYSVFFYDRRQIHIGTVIYQLFYSGFVEIFQLDACIQRESDIQFYHYVRRDCGVFVWNRALRVLQIVGCGSYEALTFALAEKTIGR